MRILLIEDNELLRDTLRQGLAGFGYVVDATGDGSEGAWQALHEAYDLILLDIMLPGRNGLLILRDLRSAGRTVPVLLLTARDGVEDRVEGLDLGADDYLTKPFAVAELLARVRALIRRGHRAPDPELKVGDLVVDSVRRCAHRAGVELDLTAREFALLEYLAVRAGAVVTRMELSEHLYESGSDPDSNAVDVFVSRVRRKLAQPGLPDLLHTRRGQGYILGARGA